MQFSQIIFLWCLCIPVSVWAAHPLITDDAGTQGQSNFQLEMNGQYDHDNDNGFTGIGGQMAATLTYGITDKIDLAVGLPYLWIEESSVLRVNGFSDATMDVKVRFWEKDGLSFAVKPGLSFPTGDDNTGLGTGKAGYHIYLIGMKEVGAWTFLANLGYIRNETDLTDNQKDLWQASAAAIYMVDEHWKVVADLVADRNTDINGNNDPVSGIIGVIYSPTKNVDLDLGFQTGFTDSATDWSLRAGTTFRF